MTIEESINTKIFSEVKEKELEKRIEGLFGLLEKIYEQYLEVIQKIDAQDLFDNIDKIFTKDRVDKLFLEVRQIKEELLLFNNIEVAEMFSMLDSALATVHRLYENGDVDILKGDNVLKNSFYNIIGNIGVLVSAKKYFLSVKKL